MDWFLTSHTCLCTLLCPSSNWSFCLCLPWVCEFLKTKTQSSSLIHFCIHRSHTAWGMAGTQQVWAQNSSAWAAHYVPAPGGGQPQCWNQATYPPGPLSWMGFHDWCGRQSQKPANSKKVERSAYWKKIVQCLIEQDKYFLYKIWQDFKTYCCRFFYSHPYTQIIYSAFLKL